MFEKKYYLKEQEKKISVRSYPKYLFLVFVFLFTINTFANIFLYPDQSKGSLLVSPLARDVIQKTVSLINSQSNSKQLKKIVLTVLGNNSNSYGVVIKNLATGERYYLNENKSFSAASLYKLWIMAVAYDQIDCGQLKDTDVLSDSIEDLNNSFGISSGSAELTDGFVSHTVKDALTQMITVSDNYSAYLLTKKVSIQNVADFLSVNGLNNSKIGTISSDPQSTAYDTYLFLDKLYNNELSDKESTDDMIELLKNQKKNSKLPRELPENIIIGHKTGELGGYSHDAGIVYTPKGNYIIVVMSYTNDTPSADNNIAEISKGVYNYFTK